MSAAVGTGGVIINAPLTASDTVAIAGQTTIDNAITVQGTGDFDDNNDFIISILTVMTIIFRLSR